MLKSDLSKKTMFQKIFSAETNWKNLLWFYYINKETCYCWYKLEIGLGITEVAWAQPLINKGFCTTTSKTCSRTKNVWLNCRTVWKTVRLKRFSSHSPTIGISFDRFAVQNVTSSGPYSANLVIARWLCYIFSVKITANCGRFLSRTRVKTAI